MPSFQVIRFVLIPCLLAVAALYLYVYFRRAAAFWGLNVKKWPVKLVLILLAAGLAASAYNIWEIPALVVLYLTISCLCMELLQGIIRLLTKGKPVIWDKFYRCGLIPVLSMLAILGIGYGNMHHIVETPYTIASEKLDGNYRVALLSDIHFGTTMDANTLREITKRIGAQKPDIVILDGDIVDEHTTRQEMQDCMRILGQMEQTHGIFFIMGNHDKSRYTDAPLYTTDQLLSAINHAGMTLLTDSVHEIGSDLALIGRDDAAYPLNGGERMPSGQLLEQTQTSRFLLLLDHQPLDVEENSRLGVDLQLSGHTHGGQIWPVGLINRLTGLNYGYSRSGGLEVIVSSGLAGWGYPIKTQGKAEYVILDLVSA